MSVELQWDCLDLIKRACKYMASANQTGDAEGFVCREGFSEWVHSSSFFQTTSFIFYSLWGWIAVGTPARASSFIDCSNNFWAESPSTTACTTSRKRSIPKYTQASRESKLENGAPILGPVTFLFFHVKWYPNLMFNIYIYSDILTLSKKHRGLQNPTL